MKKNTLILLIIFFLLDLSFRLNINAQDALSNMNDTIISGNQDPYDYVKIKSKADSHMQPAIFYQSKSKQKRPLIVYLHSWSADYKQGADLARKVAQLDWNYISPNFRGSNNKPEACGSPLVISDIEDAIDYALQNAHVNKKQIHIIGGSGGAYATLLSYMKISHKVNSFSAWNPITNLVDWYYESIGRKRIYSDHILTATSSKEILNTEEAMRRSPVFMDYPGKIRKDSRLFIYHGIHDGYEGQVPITHSLNFYNELIKKIDPGEQQALIPEKDYMDLLVKRCFPETLSGNELIGDKKVHYKRNYNNIQILIFEGKHEMLHDVVLDLIPVNDK